MCGILGSVGLDIKREDFVAALDLQEHRGPDDWGVFESTEAQRIRLGHRRLSIIDVSSHAKQPMFSSKNDVVGVFNGEIYNYLEIRQDLESQGYSFATNSDTEVLINSYHCYGEKCLDLFIGMYAFAIYDLRDDSIFIARDRLGIKPLYYTFEGNEFVFSSEVKSILALDGIQRKIDLHAVSSYLSFRYPISNNTFFEGISQLPPAHYMVYKNGKLVLKRYWDLAKEIKNNNRDSLTEDEHVENIRELFESSVRYRMIADVPVGAYLSGGVDSSAIVAQMTQLKSAGVNTFTIGFGDDDFNEFEFARVVADQYGSEHQEIGLDAVGYFATMEKLIHFKDAPLGVPNEVPLFLMSQELKKKVTVVLSGEGADEIFGGYGRIFRSADDYDKSLKLSSGDYSPDVQSTLERKFSSKYDRNRFENQLDHFLQLYRYTSLEEKRRIFHSDIDVNQIEQDLSGEFGEVFQELDEASYAAKMMYTFERLHLPGLLQRVDVTTMAASVEARVPFVDHRLVEYALTIPDAMKLKWQVDPDSVVEKLGDEISEKYDIPKSILKKAFADMLPDEILYRKKMGFPVPLDRWFGGELRGYAESLLLDGHLVKNKIICDQAVSSYLGEAGEKVSHQHAMTLWMLINLEIFYTNYFAK